MTGFRPSLRPYQRRIAKSIVEEACNAIVFLPTGAGKTFIAAEVIVRSGGKALFFVPAVALVKQQAVCLREYGLTVAEFHGGVATATLSTAAAVFVCTPAAFEAALLKGYAPFDWAEFTTIVFDEVHHTIKEHPYAHLAKLLRRTYPTGGITAGPRILGLTASLCYAMEASDMAVAIQALCAALRITRIERAERAELVAGGYVASSLAAHVDLGDDVMLPPGALQPHERQPQAMAAMFFARIGRGGGTVFSRALVGLIRRLEACVSVADPGFESPLDATPAVPVLGWGLASARRQHLCALHGQLLEFYEALRIQVVSWEVEEAASAAYLEMRGLRSLPVAWPADAADAVAAFWTSAPARYPRFDRLKAVLIAQVASIGRDVFRGILFVQDRVMTHVLAYLIARDADLFEPLRPVCFYAIGRASASLALNPTQAREKLESFRSGDANLLIATSVAEEGIDVPAANCVIRFDPPLTAVSFVQARGRARQDGSAFVLMNERPGRGAAALSAVEQLQHTLASSLSLSLSLQPPVAEAAATAAPESSHGPVAAALSQAKIDKAKAGLAAWLAAGGVAGSALKRLNEFAQSVRGTLAETSVETGRPGTGDGWACTLTLATAAGEAPLTVSGDGKGGTKKQAAGAAALRIVQRLATAE